MEVLIRKILEEVMPRLDEIKAGRPIELDKLSEGKQRIAVTVAIHCCINGPVGVNKVTTFPVIGNGSIKALVCETTNNSWKAFCRLIAILIKDRVGDCNTVSRYGNVWPLHLK